MMVQAHDPRAERTEDQLVPGMHRRGRRPIFGPRAEIAGAEQHRRKAGDLVASESRPARRTSIGRAGGPMRAGQAGGQRRGIVRNHQIAGR